MPSQPLGRRKDVDSWIIGSGNTFIHRPQLAALVMQVIEIWAVAEATTVGMVSNLIGGDRETAIAMIQAVDNQNAQRDAILAAAKQVLNPEDYVLFACTFLSVNESRKIRHSFAHHIWGFSPPLSESLLLVTPKYLNKYLAVVTTSISSKKAKIQIPEVDKSEITLWSKKALNEAVVDAQRAANVISSLRSFISRRSGPVGDSIRKRLLSDPSIAQKILSQNQQKPP